MITLNTHKPTEISVEIRIDNYEEGGTPDVRLELTRCGDAIPTFLCTPNADLTKWTTTVPATDTIYNSHQTNIDFKLIVIVGEFWFTPATGTCKLNNPPRVAVSSVSSSATSAKATITTTTNEAGDTPPTQPKHQDVLGQVVSISDKVPTKGLFPRDGLGKVSIPGM